jgi:hypothetical protein
MKMENSLLTKFYPNPNNEIELGIVKKTEKSSQPL